MFIGVVLTIIIEYSTKIKLYETKNIRYQFPFFYSLQQML